MTFRFYRWRLTGTKYKLYVFTDKVMPSIHIYLYKYSFHIYFN